MRTSGNSGKSRASAKGAGQRSPTSCAASDNDFLCVADNAQLGVLENLQHTSFSSSVSDVDQYCELQNTQWSVVGIAQRSGAEEEVLVVAINTRDVEKEETLDAHHAVEEEEALNMALNARQSAEEEDACCDEEAEALNSLLNVMAITTDASHGSPTAEGGAAAAGDVVASVVMGLEEEAELLLVTCERLHQEVSVLRAEQVVLVEDHRERTATLEAEIASLRALLGGGCGEGGGAGDLRYVSDCRSLLAMY